MTTGETIKALLKEMGMSRRVLASRLGVSEWIVSNWIRGGSMPRVEMILMMSEIFSVEIADLDPGIYDKIPECHEERCDYQSNSHCTILTHTNAQRKCSFRKIGGKAV